jgi:ABC-type branched-subunit amino acid transport system substrate-binding protein
MSRAATPRRAALGLFLVLATLTSACGARLNEEQSAALRAARQGRTGTAGVTAGGGGATATTVAGTSSGATSGSGGGVAAGPSAGAPTGGDAGGSGSTCTPAPGSTDPGVSDGEIKLGNVSTISGPVPGFGQTGLNGAKAYLNYINQTEGGVCGRKLTLVTADDRLDAGVNRAATEKLASEVLGFAGGTTVVDNGAASVINGTNIPSTGLAIGDAAIASPNFFSPNPIEPSGTTNGTTALWTYFKRTRGITKVGVVYPAQTDARTRALAYVPDIQAAGLAIDGPYEVAIAETNYTGVATKMKNNGADAFITALEVNGMSRFAQAVQQVGFTPKVPFYGAQAYGKEFVGLAGPAAEGAAIAIAYSIFEDAPNNPGIAAFVEWYQRTNPGSEPDFFAILGWAAADMMAQAIAQAGPAPTRDLVLAALGTFHQFDAHGVLAPCDPAGKKPATSFMVTTVSNGQWKREYPDAGFATS